MQINAILWRQQFVEKIQLKHGVSTSEVEQTLHSKPHVRRVERGKVKGEHFYAAFGRSSAGRYLVIFFILKRGQIALPISARDMTRTERRFYEKQK
jgi:uncharacterized DUF497 family protein